MHTSIHILHNQLENGIYLQQSAPWTAVTTLWVYYTIHQCVCLWLCMQYGRYGTVLCLSVIFEIVCCVIDTFANIYAWKAAMCIYLYQKKGGPVIIFAPLPIPFMVMSVMLSRDKKNKQASNKQTSTWRAKGCRQKWIEWQWPPVVRV